MSKSSSSCLACEPVLRLCGSLLPSIRILVWDNTFVILPRTILNLPSSTCWSIKRGTAIGSLSRSWYHEYVTNIYLHCVYLSSLMVVLEGFIGVKSVQNFVCLRTAACYNLDVLLLTCELVDKVICFIKGGHKSWILSIMNIKSASWVHRSLRLWIVNCGGIGSWLLLLLFLYKLIVKLLHQGKGFLDWDVLRWCNASALQDGLAALASCSSTHLLAWPKCGVGNSHEVALATCCLLVGSGCLVLLSSWRLFLYNLSRR